MRPAPLTSGGLALEEITCRGCGPHLQYSFLIKLASLPGNFFFCLWMWKKNGAKEPRNSTPKVPPAHARVALGSMPVPPKWPKIGKS